MWPYAGAMWAESRPLRRVAFVERCCNPGIPLVWCALFVQETTGGFLAHEWGVVLVVVYVLVVAWYGSLQELSAGALGCASVWARVREHGLRAVNVAADVGATLTFLFFLLNWFPAAWFAPLFFVTLLAHGVVAVVVARRLHALHQRPEYWGGRALRVDKVDNQDAESACDHE